MLYEIDRKDERISLLLEQDRMGNLIIRGELEGANPEEFKVYIDNSEKPKGLLLADFFIKIYAQDEEALSRLLPVLADKREVLFGGVAAWIRDYIAGGWEITWENRCWLYYLEGKKLDRELIRHEVESLKREHAELVNEHWEFGDADSLPYVEWRIEAGPSCAIFEGDEPVSWALTHGDSQMGLMFTFPQARRRGYGLSITVALAEKLLDEGKTPFLYTMQDNLPAQRLAERAGFRKWGDYRFFGARKGTL